MRWPALATHTSRDATRSCAAPLAAVKRGSASRHGGLYVSSRTPPGRVAGPWNDDGSVDSKGEYRDGDEVGVWTLYRDGGSFELEGEDVRRYLIREAYNKRNQ